MVRDKKFPSATGICDERYRIWAPDEPRACVQIIHGMAEHIERYHDFAMFLAENGFLVYGMDLPGHGKSVGRISRSVISVKKTAGTISSKTTKHCMTRS